MVVRVAERYHRLKLNFCIITFYDSQRAAITKALEVENIPSGCVYNVDSFQGPFHSSRVVFPSFSRCRPPTVDVRKRGRLRDLVFSPNPATRLFAVAAAHECRPNSLSEGHDNRFQQEVFTGTWKIYPSGEAVPVLVPTLRGLARLENHVGNRV